eukprot:353842-Chlamydomonas_euryale.AAC.6
MQACTRGTLQHVRAAMTSTIGLCLSAMRASGPQRVTGGAGARQSTPDDGPYEADKDARSVSKRGSGLELGLS